MFLALLPYIFFSLSVQRALNMQVYDSILHVFCMAGVCAMCGKQVLDTKFYKQSNV